MSRGPGRIERAIRELLDAHPDLAFVTDELVEHCYPGITTIERKHQVSVLRAAHKIIANDPDWMAEESESKGGTWVFINQANVQSMALGYLIGEGLNIYKSAKRLNENDRVRRSPYGYSWSTPIRDRASALKILSERKRYKEAMAPDGWCVRRVNWHIAYRDGDATTRAALEAERAKDSAELDAIGARIRAMLGGSPPVSVSKTPTDHKETLTHEEIGSLSDRIRALAMQNDPDALRAGLADVADELED